MGKYDDIIHLPHPEPARHPRMSRQNRAAQFAPFAALTGHEDAIRETARLTENKIQLNEDDAAKLNERIAKILLQKQRGKQRGQKTVPILQMKEVRKQKQKVHQLWKHLRLIEKRIHRIDS